MACLLAYVLVDMDMGAVDVCCAGMMQSLHDDLLLDMMRRVLLKPLCEGARVSARALSKG